MINSYYNMINNKFREYSTIDSSEQETKFSKIDDLKELNFSACISESKREKYYEDYDYPLITLEV